MAVFDIELQRMCVRVVYDGVASAGKTTNVRQLAELFATQRTCELYSPAEMDGRTLYFDWLQIAAGMVCGFPLVCQVITVPGQVALTPRRRHLLSTADVVVYVCDSDLHGIARAQEGLVLFDEVERARGEAIPLVVQANKQDQAGAVSGASLLATLGRTTIPVVEAIASDGIGVVDTFVSSVRAAIKTIKDRVESGNVCVAVQRVESASSVLQKLSAEELDPEWSIEMMLEEASNAFMVGDARGLEGNTQGGDRVSAPPSLRREAASDRVPVLPTDHVPTGFIWPAHTGRAALRALAGKPELRRPVVLDDDGVASVVVGDILLSTNESCRFDSSELARQALVRAARERTQLGTLLAPETVLVAQPSGRDDVSWLWMLHPFMSTVAQLVASPALTDATDSELTRSTVVAAFGSALVDALKVEARHGVVVNLSPRSFGLHQGTARYIGEVHAAGPGRRDTGRALEDALGALATLCDDIEPAVVALESGLRSSLSAEELAHLAGGATWQGTTGPASLADAQRRLEEAFNRGRRAA